MKFAVFNKKSTPEKPPEEVTARLDRLEANMRQLLLEWEDTYERLMRMYKRATKRLYDADRRTEREEQEEKTRQEAAGTTIPGMPGLDPISAAIHARRMRVPPRTDGR